MRPVRERWIARQIRKRLAAAMIPIMIAMLGQTGVRAATPVADGLPDGGVATFATGLVREAWYIEPTTRYAHGALGDLIEGGGLAIRRADAQIDRVLLSERIGVYEDLVPRLVDLDGDGQAEIVSIVSNPKKGAYVIVRAVRQIDLIKGRKLGTDVVAQSKYNGKPFTWLNIAGFGDYNGDGFTDIAIVRTPHVGGKLEFLTYRPLNKNEMQLQPIGATEGFSNHVFGSRLLGLSANIDWNGDGLTDLVVPSADRRTMRVMGFVKGRLRQLHEVAMTAPVIGDFVVRDGKVIVPLADGTRFELGR